MHHPVRAGVIGAGLMGRVHAEAAKRAGATIVAVADPDMERATKLARSIGGSCEAIAADRITVPGFVDAIHVCTPPNEHFAVCEAALRSGVHVICEKPVAPESREVEALLAVARQSRVHLCPVHQFPFQSGMRRIVEQALSLGTVKHMHAEICTAGGEGMSDERRHQVALDIIPHPLSLFAAFATTPLQNVEWSVSTVSYGELIVSGVSGNTGLSFLLSTSGRPTSNSLRVIGDKATATADLFHGFAVIERGTVSRLTKATRPFVASALTLGNAAANGLRRGLAAETAFPGLRELVSRFYNSVRGEAATPISPVATADIAISRDRIISLIQLAS